MSARTIEIAGGLMVGVVLFGAAMAAACAFKRLSTTQVAVPAVRIDAGARR
jgi:hypothetical protein